MFQRMLASALGAGIAAGLIAAALHFAFIQNIILLGEQYETGALVHYGAAGSQPDHDHADGAAVAGAEGAAADDADSAGHSHSAAGGQGALQRNGLTVLFTVLIYVSYAFLLVAAFGVAEALGKTVGPAEGLIWGVAGFAAFQLAPAMGLAPELPGTIAAELSLRQIWWWMTVACTASGLALLAYGRHWLGFALAGALLALPHVIGAPQAEGYWGTAPTELGALFAARVLGVALVVWAVMGWLAGVVWSREAARLG